MESKIAPNVVLLEVFNIWLDLEWQKFDDRETWHFFREVTLQLNQTWNSWTRALKLERDHLKKHNFINFEPIDKSFLGSSQCSGCVIPRGPGERKTNRKSPHSKINCDHKSRLVLFIHFLKPLFDRPPTSTRASYRSWKERLVGWKIRYFFKFLGWCFFLWDVEVENCTFNFINFGIKLGFQIYQLVMCGYSLHFAPWCFSKPEK